MKCVRCNKEIGEGVKFCNYCGMSILANYDNDLNETSDLQNLKDGKYKKKISCKKSTVKNVRKLFTVFILLFILLAASVLSVYFVKYGNIYKMVNTVSVLLDKAEGLNSKIQDMFEKESMDDAAAENKKAWNPESDEDNTAADPNLNINEDIDIEEEVSKISKQYNDIILAISSDRYEKVAIKQGVTAYYDNNELKSVTVAKNIDEIAYSRLYYYDNSKLFFACYEGDDSHRFYFFEDKLIRWRYLSSGADVEDAVNYDMKNSEEYKAWENNVLFDSRNFFDIWKSAV